MSMLKPAAILFAGIGLSAGLGGCQGTQSYVKWRPDGQPLHEQPYQNWWQYQFVYHEESQVYFEPYSGMYYWFADGQWEQGSSMPEYMQLWPKKAGVVRLQNPKPYIQHASVVQWSWPHDRAWPTSTDEYHWTAEAIAASEQRAIDRRYGFQAMQNGVEGPPSNMNNASGEMVSNETMSGSESSPSGSEFSGTSNDSASTSSSSSSDMMTGVDTSSDSNPQ